MEVKKIFGKGVMKCLNVLALLLVIQTANSACIWVAHQPKFPEVANKLKFSK
jgi:cyclic lactone autoinducer peptide